MLLQMIPIKGKIVRNTKRSWFLHHVFMQWNDKSIISFLETTPLFGRRSDYFCFHCLKHEVIDILVDPQDAQLDGNITITTIWERDKFIWREDKTSRKIGWSQRSLIFLLTNNHLIAQKPQPRQSAFQGQILFYSLSWLYFLVHSAEVSIRFIGLRSERTVTLSKWRKLRSSLYMSHGRSIYLVWDKKFCMWNRLHRIRVVFSSVQRHD